MHPSELIGLDWIGIATAYLSSRVGLMVHVHFTKWSLYLRNTSSSSRVSNVLAQLVFTINPLCEKHLVATDAELAGTYNTHLNNAESVAPRPWQNVAGQGHWSDYFKAKVKPS